MPKPPRTAREMHKVIATVMEREYGVALDPRPDVRELSPSGERGPVLEICEWARALREEGR